MEKVIIKNEFGDFIYWTYSGEDVEIRSTKLWLNPKWTKTQLKDAKFIFLAKFKEYIKIRENYDTKTEIRRVNKTL